ncbi:hypothetical protein C2G38_2147680 [Gigaspora rosea]|uniref:BACK domain-containing protein n=1 Tax=Gigaspora rosea TaxID=44941 RepID=A0A397UJ79_9GLOM|nr:hypothetical protein C2G38_2147680 [Gigaspora rosea]
MLTFYDKLSQDFTKLLESEYNYDTIIEVCEQPDTQLFKKLANTIKGNNIFNIKLLNISVKTFNIVIKYIYGSVVSLENLETSDILNLLITFNEFNFSESVDRLQTLLIEDNASWLRLNFSHIYQISFQNENFKALQQFCNEIIIKQPNLIFDSDNFTSLQENALISLIKHDELQLDESVIWDKVILWGKAQTPDLPSDYELWNKKNFKSLKLLLKTVYLILDDQLDALYYGKYHGPDFNVLCHSERYGPKKWYYKSKNNTYQPPIRNAENYYFSMDDYEVFQICKNV